MSLRCRICKNNLRNKKYVTREMFFGTGEAFEYFQCSACGCLQISQIPSDLSKYYPPNYHSCFNQEREMLGIKNLMRRYRNEYALFKKGIMGRFLNKMRKTKMPFEPLGRIERIKQKSILDVGCGTGFLLNNLKGLGIPNLLGIDPFIEKNIVYSNGVRILKKSLHELRDETTSQYDVIMFNHSFEHIPDPEETLKTASALLSDDGTVLVRIPVVDSYAWKHYQTNWVQLDAPRHLFLFSRASINILSGNTGFLVGDIIYDSDEFQFWGSELYKKNVSLIESTDSLLSRMFKKTEMTCFKKQAIELNKRNLGDMAVFYLRKNTPLLRR